MNPTSELTDTEETETIILSLVTDLFEDTPHLGPKFLIYLALKLHFMAEAMDERDTTTTH